jgi:hypothetical protein
LLRRAARLRNDGSEEQGATVIRVTKKGEQGTTQAETSNRRTLQFLKEPHGVTTQKTPFFIVTAVKTSNFTLFIRVRPDVTSLQLCNPQKLLMNNPSYTYSIIYV